MIVISLRASARDNRAKDRGALALTWVSVADLGSMLLIIDGIVSEKGGWSVAKTPTHIYNFVVQCKQSTTENNIYRKIKRQRKLQFPAAKRDKEIPDFQIKYSPQISVLRQKKTWHKTINPKSRASKEAYSGY